MAGQPKKQAIIRVLTERARAEIDDGAGPLDYALHWIESGKTILQLASEIGKASGMTIERPQVSRVLHSLTSDAEERIARARVHGGSSMTEIALGETMAMSADRDAAAKQKLVNEQRWRMAGTWNPELKEQRGAQVSITLNTVHLDALRIPEPASVRIVNPPVAEVIEAEVIEQPRLTERTDPSGGNEVSGP